MIFFYDKLISCDEVGVNRKCCFVGDFIDNSEKSHLVHFKSKKDIDGIRKAGELVVRSLDVVEKEIRSGVTTSFINDIVHKFTIQNGAIPAPLNYRGYPKSTCISVNEVICHGIPNDNVLKNGDIVNVDITSILDGYYADASKSYFVGNPENDARKVFEVAKCCLLIGMSMVLPGNTLGDIGYAIQSYAESHGCSVVREFVGHGIGINFHEPPQVPHYGMLGGGIELIPNMVITIEPMVNFGKKELYILDDGWTAITSDGSLSAQFEQTLLVTDDGYESLTPYEF